MSSNKPVQIVEVGPRDGLQHERVWVSTETKVAYVNALARSGLRRIEVTSFVHPGAVPQLVDAEKVLARIDRPEGVRFSALVPNMHGFERAQSCNLDEIAVFTGATDSFVRRNINMSIDESIAAFKPVVDAGLAAGIGVRGYVSTVFGCPYDGVVKPQAGIDVALRLFDLGCSEVSIGDTIGVATPGSVRTWLEVAGKQLPLEHLALHFHDTRGTALANVMAAAEVGITVFDASAGGLGGCPFAPGASGNVATDDLVYSLHGTGYETGIHLGKLVAASRIIASELDHLLPGRYFQAERVNAPFE